ncbi:uncharacterized protein LOC117644220 [Thrips palmi]|uniref:Uncharacterized protein LOC117644220 n=1 Tax=Thrips palmi TaxID=161013 RepID=A0A6P8ZLS8_THRPL|nr:uncharacterized protein LOC117644220 [Thrips palmi]
MAPRKLTEEQRERKRERARQLYREKRDKRLLLAAAHDVNQGEGGEARGRANRGDDAGDAEQQGSSCTAQDSKQRGQTERAGAHHCADAKQEDAAETASSRVPAEEQLAGSKDVSSGESSTLDQRKRKNGLQRARKDAGLTPEKRQRKHELQRARRQAGLTPEARQRKNELERLVLHAVLQRNQLQAADESAAKAPP